MNVTGILDALQSHALTLGLFERVNLHEPKNAPGRGLTAALWVQRIGPVPAGSGLQETTGIVTFTLRIYSDMLQEPQDAIDPNVLTATDVLMTAYSAAFTLDGLVRNIDLLGAHSPNGLSAQAGYLDVGGRKYRVMDLTIPCIVNDLWEQVA